MCANKYQNRAWFDSYCIYKTVQFFDSHDSSKI